MKTKRSLLLSLITVLLFSTNIYGQSEATTTNKKTYPFYLEYIMGPYLFVDHIPYDAVMMNGCRLGFNLKPKFNMAIEYVVGQQQDDQNTLGMTHNVNTQFIYNFLPESKPFKPYLFAGGGFFEFKAFSSDVYGISWNLGGGSTVKFTDRISGVMEARYLNLSQMKLGGEHELAVFWGARVAF